MFKRIKSYFRRSRPKYPTFTIQIGPESVDVLADWEDPDKLTAAQISSYGERTAITLLAISNGGGAGLNEFERAIGKNGDLRKDQAFANRLLGLIRTKVQSGGLEENTTNNYLVSADKIFPGNFNP